MDIFLLTIKQMLVLFTFILIGFVLRRSKIMPEQSGTILSKLETYVLCPALGISNMIKNCRLDTLSANLPFVFCGALIVVVMILISYPLSRLIIPRENGSSNDYKRCIYRYAIAISNYGFVGNVLVLNIWGDEGLFKYLMFTFFISIFTSTWGMLMLIPKGESKGMKEVLSRAFLNPPIIGLMIGILLGILGFRQFIPDFLSTSLKNATDCYGPIAMIIAGLVVGGYNFKEIIKDKKVYIMTALRLVVFPMIIVCVLKLLGVSNEICVCALIAFGAPLGLNTIVYPATYGGETKTGASMVLISHTLSVITIPLMYYLLFVL